MGVGMRVDVFVLFQHELVSLEKKIKVGIDGRNEEKKKQKEKLRQKGTSKYEFTLLKLHI